MSEEIDDAKLRKLMMHFEPSKVGGIAGALLPETRGHPLPTRWRKENGKISKFSKLNSTHLQNMRFER